jgi:hypothetical protein
LRRLDLRRRWRVVRKWVHRHPRNSGEQMA